jgi:uncharacterized protein YutE (UPF0331/DUF86 family)
MVDRDKVEGLIRHLCQYTEHLREIAKLDREKFLKDPMAIGSARYYMLVSIESCIDIANHIIATERLRSPKDYRDTFRVLNEAGIIPDDFAQTLQAMAGLRNLLVHLYGEVDDEMIFDSLDTELCDFETFIAYIIKFLEETLKE